MLHHPPIQKHLQNTDIKGLRFESNWEARVQRTFKNIKLTPTFNNEAQMVIITEELFILYCK